MILLLKKTRHMNSCEGDEPALNVTFEREAPNIATNPEVIQQSARVANHAQPPFSHPIHQS